MIVFLTPAMLRALGEGVERLEKGDESDCAKAKEVRNTMARDHKLVLSRYEWFPAADVTSGYVKIEGYDEPDLASQNVNDEGWSAWVNDGWKSCEVSVPAGTVLYLDYECTVPLKTL